MTFLPLGLIFVVFYFLLIRPQQKKLKAHQTMLGALRRGDRVVTNGGIIGVVVKVVNDQEVQLEIADNTHVRVMRAMISDIMTKGTPVENEPASEKTPKKASESKTIKSRTQLPKNSK